MGRNPTLPPRTASRTGGITCQVVVADAVAEEGVVESSIPL